MPKMVLTAEFVSISGVNLSAFARKVELKLDVEDKDVTTFASLGYKEVLGGLKGGELACEWLQDFAVGGPDATLWPLFGTVVGFEVRPVNTAASAINPKYTGSVLIKEYSPIQGKVGDEATTTGSYPTSGVVTRGTS